MQTTLLQRRPGETLLVGTARVTVVLVTDDGRCLLEIEHPEAVAVERAEVAEAVRSAEEPRRKRA